MQPISPPKTPIFAISALQSIIDPNDQVNYGMQKIIDHDQELANQRFFVIYLNTTSTESVGHFSLYEHDPNATEGERFKYHQISGNDNRCGLNAILTAFSLTADLQAKPLISQSTSGSWGIENLNPQSPDYKKKFDAWINKSLSLDSSQSWIPEPIKDIAGAITRAIPEAQALLPSELITEPDSIEKSRIKERLAQIANTGVGNELELAEVMEFLRLSNSQFEYKNPPEIIFSQEGQKKIEELTTILSSEKKILEQDIKFLDFSETSQDFINSKHIEYFPKNTDYAELVDSLSKKFLEQILSSEEAFEDEKRKKIGAFCEKVEELIPHIIASDKKLSLEISVQKLKIVKEGGKKEITELLDFSKPYYDQPIFSEENVQFANLVEIPNQLLANPQGQTRKYGFDLDLDKKSKTLTIAFIRDKPTREEEKTKGVHGKVKEGDKITSINGKTIADIIKKCQEKSINPRDEIARLFAMEKSLDLTIDRQGSKYKIEIGDDPDRIPPLNDKRMIDYGQSPNPKKKISSVAIRSPVSTPSTAPAPLRTEAEAKTNVAGIDPVEFGSKEIIDKIPEFLRMKSATDASYQQNLEGFFRKNPNNCDDAQYKLEIVACSKMLKHIDSQFTNMKKILQENPNAIMLFAGNENTGKISFGNGLAVDQWQTNPLSTDPTKNTNGSREMNFLNKLIHDYIIYKYKELKKDRRFSHQIKVGTIGTGYTKKDGTRVPPYQPLTGEVVYHVFGANVDNSNMKVGKSISGGGQADSVSGSRDSIYKTISLITTPVKCTKDNVDDITKPDPVHEKMTKSPPHSPPHSSRHSTAPLSPIEIPAPTVGVAL
jgi:hypothetical protein